MSKLYFAKYRPVEGEIKEGETGISINNATYTHFNHLGKNYGKPARLFLCSRDIKPEDYLKEGNVHIYHDSSEPPFKVIGEISPEATWIKENMEFDERDLAFNSDESEERLPVGKGKVFLMGFDWAKPEADYKGFIYIKCPCGHFH